MKKLNYYRPSFCQFRIRHFISVSFTISILIAMTLMLSSYSYNAKAYTDDLEFSRHLILPDSIDDSTTITENYGYGDTMFFYLDGPDTIYVLFADTTTNDSVSTLERAYTSQDILISLSEIELPVQNGLYGFNISDFYRFTHYDPNDNEIYEDLELENPHELIVSLAPKNLRYPSGASSKFRHAFGSMNSTNPDNPFAGLKNGGYGINIEELIPYYNKSDNVIDIISFLSIYIDYTEDMQFDIDGTWLTNDVKSSFEDYFGEWLEQPHYVPAAYLGLWEEPLHINEFIRTIDAIQEGNPGFTVDVIFTLNILSEPAEVCKEIVNYLRYETNNHVVNVNVVGVELGNESYASFFAKTMGFNPFDGHTAFEHYWFYINGTDDYDVSLPGAGDDFNLTDVLPAAMIGLTPGGINRHDYIRAFKTDATFDEIKIGIPAENPSYLPAEDDGPFIVEPDEDQPGGGANMGPQVIVIHGTNVYITDTVKQFPGNINLMLLFHIYILPLKMITLLLLIQIGVKFR